MKRAFFLMLYFLLKNSYANSEIDILSYCETTLNEDKKPDIALLISSGNSSKLFVLLSEGNKFQKISVSKNVFGMKLSCEKGSSLNETAAGNSKKRKFTTNGYYIKLYQPEGAIVAYYLDKGKLIEVWLAD